MTAIHFAGVDQGYCSSFLDELQLADWFLQTRVKAMLPYLLKNGEHSKRFITGHFVTVTEVGQGQALKKKHVLYVISTGIIRDTCVHYYLCYLDYVFAEESSRETPIW